MSIDRDQNPIVDDFSSSSGSSKISEEEFDHSSDTRSLLVLDGAGAVG
jgi:hypothetical protein